jgi:hypothetical protein
MSHIQANAELSVREMLYAFSVRLPTHSRPLVPAPTLSPPYQPCPGQAGPHRLTSALQRTPSYRPALCPYHVCTGTGLTPATPAPGRGSPLPHLHRDRAHAAAPPVSAMQNAAAGARGARRGGGGLGRRVPRRRLADRSSHSDRSPRARGDIRLRRDGTAGAAGGAAALARTRSSPQQCMAAAAAVLCCAAACHGSRIGHAIGREVGSAPSLPRRTCAGTDSAHAAATSAPGLANPHVCAGRSTGTAMLHLLSRTTHRHPSSRRMLLRPCCLTKGNGSLEPVPVQMWPW